MDNNIEAVAPFKCNRGINWISGGLAVLTLLMLGSVISQPSMFEYQNYDDACYSSIGVKWSATGAWRPAFQPLGLIPSESYFAANPVLTPILTGAAVKVFGPDRWVFKLPSLGAFIAAAFALSCILHIAKLHFAHGVVVLFSYYACPWLYFAMNTARAEPFCIAGLYFAMLFSLIWSKSTRSAYSAGWLLLSGALVVLVVWNHPLFAMSALLPALAVLFYGDKNGYRRAILFWLAGVFLMVVCLVAWRILPHWDAWKEQFLANASSNASISNIIKPVETFKSSRPFPINELVDLKARFSTLGWPFVCWYAGVPLLFAAFLRPTRYFLFSFLLVLAFLAVIEIKTPILATYVVSSALSLPLCLVFAASKRHVPNLPGARGPLLVAFVVFVSILHEWLVLQPATRTNDWNIVEQQLEQQINSLSPGSVIWGGLAQGMVPAWKHGDTYYMTTWNFLINVPGVKEKLNKLNLEQPHYQVESIDGKWRVVWHGKTKETAVTGEDEQ